ncbi:MAG TPA: ROK family protein [Anaerolineae bacterium]|nr:ROK family protein [Anaerolineae bacterium]
MKLYGSIEAGGTKFVCVIGSGPDNIVAEARIATTTPAETIGRTIDFFQRHGEQYPVSAVGIGSFGPVDLDRSSPTYGYITTTPKPHWAQADLCGAIRQALNVPVAFDTDVNAAAFGEHHWVAENHALDPLLYLTIGTGIGLGAIVNGKPLHGLLHPEAGHMLLPHDRTLDPFEGACPFHGDCWEGLAAGPAVEKRWQQRGETLSPDHPAWQLEAHYVALAVVNLIYCLSPQRVVLGGGVMQQPGIIDRVRGEVQRTINHYLQSDRITRDIDQLIVPPGLGTRSGVLGAMALAITAE